MHDDSNTDVHRDTFYAEIAKSGFTGKLQFYVDEDDSLPEMRGEDYYHKIAVQQAQELGLDKLGMTGVEKKFPVMVYWVLGPEGIRSTEDNFDWHRDNRISSRNHSPRTPKGKTIDEMPLHFGTHHTCTKARYWHHAGGNADIGYGDPDHSTSRSQDIRNLTGGIVGELGLEVQQYIDGVGYMGYDDDKNDRILVFLDGRDQTAYIEGRESLRDTLAALGERYRLDGLFTLDVNPDTPVEDRENWLFVSRHARLDLEDSHEFDLVIKKITEDLSDSVLDRQYLGYGISQGWLREKDGVVTYDWSDGGEGIREWIRFLMTRGIR